MLDHGYIKSFNSIKVSNLDKVLVGAYPELLENMIPVVYDNEKKAWIKADSRIKYFDYENKIWANAVYVRRVKDIDDPNSHNREYYLSDDAIGQIIYDKDIIAQYVFFSERLFQSDSGVLVLWLACIQVSPALPVLLNVSFHL